MTQKSLTSTMLSKLSLVNLLVLQHETNELYNPAREWTDHKFGARLRAATFTEYAELLDEMTSHWKWYDKKAHTNRVDAIYELVDVVHFQLSTFLWCFPTQGAAVIAIQEEYPEDILLCNHGEDVGFMTHMISTFDRHVTKEPSKFNQAQMVKSMLGLISATLTILGYDTEEYLAAHYAKNQRNRVRARKGVMRGIDVKKDETPLPCPSLLVRATQV